MVLPLQKQVFRFSVLQLQILLYTLTQPLIAKIYTPDSAMGYSLRSRQQVYKPYMTACSTLYMHTCTTQEQSIATVIALYVIQQIEARS